MHRAAFLIAAKRDRLARGVVAAAMIERLVSKAGARVVAADGVGSGSGPETALMRSCRTNGLTSSRTSAAPASEAGPWWNGAAASRSGSGSWVLASSLTRTQQAIAMTNQIAASGLS